MMIKALLLKFEEVQVEKKLLFLLEFYLECIQDMLNVKDGKLSFWIPMKQKLEALRKSFFLLRQKVHIVD